MSILLIVLSWALLGFSVWFSYQVIRDLRIANRKRKPMATMYKPSDEFIKWQKATQLAAIDDKMPDDAILTPKKKPKAMTAPIKRNKPKRKPQTRGKGK